MCNVSEYTLVNTTDPTRLDTVSQQDKRENAFPTSRSSTVFEIRLFAPDMIMADGHPITTDKYIIHVKLEKVRIVRRRTLNPTPIATNVISLICSTFDNNGSRRKTAIPRHA